MWPLILEIFEILELSLKNIDHWIILEVRYLIAAHKIPLKAYTKHKTQSVCLHLILHAVIVLIIELPSTLGSVTRLKWNEISFNDNLLSNYQISN